MDARLATLDGRRLVNLRRSDCPAVALAIVGHIRKQCRAYKDVFYNTSVIRIVGQGVDVVIRGDDWAKIIPYLQDGSFNPQVVPVPTPVVIDPNRRLNISTLDIYDKQLYNRVLGVLQGLFLDDYPVSNL